MSKIIFLLSLFMSLSAFAGLEEQYNEAYRFAYASSGPLNLYDSAAKEFAIDMIQKRGVLGK